MEGQEVLVLKENYIVDDFLVSPETPILYKQYNLDTITVNEDGSDLNPLYIQNNNDELRFI